MRDWIDSPVPGYKARIEADYWCRQCKERYCRTLHFDGEVGEYGGDESCPLCGHDGVAASEVEDNMIE